MQRLPAVRRHALPSDSADRVKVMHFPQTHDLGSQFGIAVTALIVTTGIMYMSARIAAVPRADIGRAFMATIGVATITGLGMTLMQAFGGMGILVLGGLFVIASVAVIRMVFQTGWTPAFLVWLVNVMIQVLMASFYVRMMMPDVADPVDPGALPYPPEGPVGE